MKNKSLILIIVLSFSLLFSIFYVNYYMKNIYVKDFEEYEKVEVFSDYKNKKISFLLFVLVFNTKNMLCQWYIIIKIKVHLEGMIK